jgi:hypothetical protein
LWNSAARTGSQISLSLAGKQREREGRTGVKERQVLWNKIWSFLVRFPTNLLKAPLADLLVKQREIFVGVLSLTRNERRATCREEEGEEEEEENVRDCWDDDVVMRGNVL